MTKNVFRLGLALALCAAMMGCKKAEDAAGEAGDEAAAAAAEAAGAAEDAAEGKRVLWTAELGSQTYGNPVIAGGKVFVGTNNAAAYLKRYPNKVDLGCLIAFNEADGKFLWQHSSEKLSTGRVHDWPFQGICCAPLIEGKRLWFVTSRGEVRCLDTKGFHDGEDDGPVTDEIARITDIMAASPRRRPSLITRV